MTLIIDGDSHMFETRSMWRDYSPSADKELALSIETDALGYSWIMLGDRSLDRAAWVAGPSGGRDFSPIGLFRKAYREQVPNPTPTYDELPEAFWSPSARVRKLDEWHIDESLVFCHWGFGWEYDIWNDREASQVNMAAWNRFCADIVADSGGRLHPVGHVRLDADPRWLANQLRALQKAGVRFVLFTPMLVDGRRLSHPDLDYVWRLFEETNLIPTWHVSNNARRIFDDVEGWSDNDVHSVWKLVPHLFTRVAPQIGLVDLALNGVFERYPSLRIVFAELGADWFPQLCQRINRSWDGYEEISGKPFSDLPRLPGDYLRERVLLVCSFPSDADATLLSTCGSQLAYGGDFPHPEGLDNPFEEYQSRMKHAADVSVHEAFFGRNLANLLRGES
jgi:predicted TIM-barrel fold metal-dependent hydrolase